MTVSFKNVIDRYLAIIEDEMARIDSYQSVPLFYDPIHYMLDLKGKRIRPLLTPTPNRSGLKSSFSSIYSGFLTLAVLRI